MVQVDPIGNAPDIAQWRKGESHLDWRQRLRASQISHDAKCEARVTDESNAPVPASGRNDSSGAAKQIEPQKQEAAADHRYAGEAGKRSALRFSEGKASSQGQRHHPCRQRSVDEIGCKLRFEGQSEESRGQKRNQGDDPTGNRAAVSQWKRCDQEWPNKVELFLNRQRPGVFHWHWDHMERMIIIECICQQAWNERIGRRKKRCNHEDAKIIDGKYSERSF